MYEKVSTVWSKIVESLRGYPERLSVARVFVENGLSIRREKIYCNEIEIPPIRISRVAKVDRRTVSETIKAIEEDTELCAIFRDIRSAGLSLKEVARHLSLGVVEITPTSARTPGILAKAASILAENKTSIRQAIVDDPELSPEPKLTIIARRR